MLESYRSHATPTTLTRAHVRSLLDITLTFGTCPQSKLIGCRDHVIILLGVAVGLREHEITALTITDVFDSEQRAKEAVLLRVFKGHRRGNGTQEVFFPDDVREALDNFLRVKHAARESLAPDAPLFVGRRRKALSTRQVRHSFRVWQERARLPRVFNFHALRHTACSAVQEQSGDIRVTQEFARHRSIQTTMIYTHPSRDAIARAVSAAAASWTVGRRYAPRR